MVKPKFLCVIKQKRTYSSGREEVVLSGQERITSLAQKKSQLQSQINQKQEANQNAASNINQKYEELDHLQKYSTKNLDGLIDRNINKCSDEISSEISTLSNIRHAAEAGHNAEVNQEGLVSAQIEDLENNDRVHLDHINKFIAKTLLASNLPSNERRAASGILLDSEQFNDQLNQIKEATKNLNASKEELKQMEEEYNNLQQKMSDLEKEISEENQTRNNTGSLVDDYADVSTEPADYFGGDD